MAELTAKQKEQEVVAAVNQDYAEKYGFSDAEDYVYKAEKGLDEKLVRTISAMKKEPEWMLNFRLKAYAHYLKRPMPEWGPDLSVIDFDDVYYYIKPTKENSDTWDDVPDYIKETFDKLGIPEAEQKFLSGAAAQYESEVIYHNIEKELEELGVIFMGMDDALAKHPDLVREYFNTIIPYADNKFTALNTAVWSGGSFIYVPPGVHVKMPLQAYFRINAKNMGQFERTLIIIDKDAYVHYIEGCTAPIYSEDSFHSGVIEILVKEGGRCRYSTIQNWSTNVYNLVTQRAVAEKNATMEWVDANLGCLAEGSSVTTPHGLVPIEDINVGDEVLSYDEQSGELCYRPVTAKRFSGRQYVHTVSVGERKLQVTANHPFYSYIYDPDKPKKSGRYQLAYVRADHLKEAIIPRQSIPSGTPYALDMPVLETTFASSNQYADTLTMSRTRLSKMKVDTFTTDDMMWLFGYWIGDGDIQMQYGKTENVVRWAKVGFSAPVQDRARGRLVETMAAVIDAEPTERADGVHLSWNSKELAEFFHVNGFEGKAGDKRVPAWVWSLPESQRLAFIGGYMDADGTTRGRYFNLKSANKHLLEDTASLLVTLGITSRLNTEFDEPRQVEIMGVQCTAHSSHRLEFFIDERFYPHISPALRKRAEMQPPRQNSTRRTVGRSNIVLSDAVEIVPVNVSDATAVKRPTWDIEVAGTGNFISQGFIVHNSKITMKYPAVVMKGEGAHGEILSIAFAGEGQQQDAGGKVIHAAPNTTSRIVSKSISQKSGRSSYRGLLKVYNGAENCKSNVVCDALLLDPDSRSDTYPYIEIDAQDVNIGHEASVSKVGEEQLFYLMSRGIDEQTATSMIVNGFIEPLVKELPMEYAIEMNRLIQLQMEGSIG